MLTVSNRITKILIFILPQNCLFYHLLLPVCHVLLHICRVLLHIYCDMQYQNWECLRKIWTTTWFQVMPYSGSRQSGTELAFCYFRQKTRSDNHILSSYE